MSVRGQVNAVYAVVCVLASDATHPTINPTMATKTRPYGTQSVAVKMLPHMVLIRNDGTKLWSWDIQSNHPNWVRRIGHGSTISSQSGVDGRFRPCTHVKHSYFTRPLSVLPEYLYWRTTFTSPSSEKHSYAYEMMSRVHKLRYPQFIAACEATTLSLSSTQWNALAAQALNTMLPSFADGNSYINYLLELKDFKDVMGKLTRIIEPKLDAATRVINALRKKKSPRQKPMEWLSKRYLEYQFGWKPLYKDLVSFFTTSRRFLLRYEEIVKRATIPQQRYWGTWISGTETADQTTYTNTGDGIGASGLGYSQAKVVPRVIRRGSPGVRFHATVRYRYPLPEALAGVGGKLKAYLDLIGVNANPAVLWNAIPFSFVVDWFVNVSGFLNRLRVENIHFQTEILDFCTSAKVEATVDYTVQAYQSTYADPPVGYWGPEIVMDTCKRSVYERRLGLPNFLTAFQTSGLNQREFLLTGALAGARSRRR